MSLVTLDKAATVLSTTSGYDAVVRVVLFTTALAATKDDMDKETKKFLSDISSKASLTRLILHLTQPPNMLNTLRKTSIDSIKNKRSPSPLLEIFNIIQNGKNNKQIISDIIPQLQILSRTALMVRYLCEHFLLLSKIEPKSYLGLDGPEFGRRTATFGTVYNSIECLINALRIVDYFNKSDEELSKLSVLSRLQNILISTLISSLDLLSAYSSARKASLLSDRQSAVVGSTAAILSLYLRFVALS